MAERKTPTYSFSRRLGYAHYDVDVTCDPDAKATYEDRLLELIRSLPRRIITRRENCTTISRLPDAGISVYQTQISHSNHDCRT